ncbi:hypothetical protein KRX19_10665 [Cardiobacteriaceae bacterium TAE3-ERU3]|nr:hypothetical protein [Cardiobacteriaceae bacterium TAE3-ERU3]
MRNCTEMTKLLSDGMERPLTLGEKAEIFIHTGMCRPCRQFKKNTQSLHELLQLHREHQSNDSNENG